MGLAYSPRLERAASDFAIDYFEVPFELLARDPEAYERLQPTPVVLHCASLSLAGAVRPTAATVRQIRRWAARTRTPWLGEHLASLYVAAQGRARGAVNLGFTVAPAMNEQTMRRVVKHLHAYSKMFAVPLLVENSPLYFSTPDSTMDQIEWINRICDATPVNLLLDLTHLYISAMNLHFDAGKALERLPLDRVVEIHLSGVSREGGVYWDCHAAEVPAPVIELFQEAIRRTRVRAVTLEMNWLGSLTYRQIGSEVERIRVTANNGR